MGSRQLLLPVSCVLLPVSCSLVPIEPRLRDRDGGRDRDGAGPASRGGAAAA